MQDTDRKAFDEILGELFAALDKPLGESQRSTFWKSLADVSLLEFARCRDHLLSEWREREEPLRKFTPGDIWRVRKALRAPPPVRDGGPAWDGDAWDQVANQQLLRHITNRIPKDPLCYGHRSLPEFASNIGALVAMKNRWADLMRQSVGPDGVPAQEQREVWDECMRMAEQAMAQERAA